MITQVGGMDSSVAEFTLSTANVLPLNDNLQTDPLSTREYCGFISENIPVNARGAFFFQKKF